MSERKKLPGGQRAQDELTRFKYHWRDVLSPAQQDFWRSRFHSMDTQAVIREEIRVKLKFDLKYDKQITLFRQWDEEQQENEAEAERQHQEELDLRRLHPDWTDEQLRQEVINGSYRRALSKGDYKLGLATVREERGLIQAQTDQQRFRRETCELFLKWSADQRARDIAASTSSNADKIEQLGQIMFGEDWRA